MNWELFLRNVYEMTFYFLKTEKKTILFLQQMLLCSEYVIFFLITEVYHISTTYLILISILKNKFLERALDIFYSPSTTDIDNFKMTYTFWVYPPVPLPFISSFWTSVVTASGTSWPSF